MLDPQKMPITALMEAAERGDLEAVKANLNDVGKSDEYGNTALIRAVYNGHADCIPLLKAEAGRWNSCEWTALMWAAFNGHVACVRLLLSEVGKQPKEGSKIHISNELAVSFPAGITALMLAANRNHPKVVELLLPYEQGLTDSKGHTAKWHANNSDLDEDFTKVRKLLEGEGVERILPPSNLVIVPKLPAEAESLKKEFASFDGALDKTKKVSFQSDQEIDFLKHQLQKAIDESEKHMKMYEDLQKVSEQNQILINELVAANEYLQDQLSSAKNDLDETKKKLSQSSQEVASLKQKIQEAERSLAKAKNEASFLKEQLPHSHMDSEALKRELADQKARNISLEKEVVHLRTESQNAKDLQAERDDLQRRLKEAEEKNRDLLKNLTEAGNRLVTGSIDQDS